MFTIVLREREGRTVYKVWSKHHMMERTLEDDRERSEGPSGTELDRDLWRQFVQATSPKAFCQSWLPIQCRMLRGVRCGMVLLGNPEDFAEIFCSDGWHSYLHRCRMRELPLTPPLDEDVRVGTWSAQP